ncbi:ribosome maturation factor RimP [Isoptericola croceus]|uniref:ribosome maturation factor RimP n=1 Tax=Isoptericola croceus TaxID=3031406 RepID=UPI0023F799A4|nr:ribosome maturation factor RimP [Isoptericola croceus]
MPAERSRTSDDRVRSVVSPVVETASLYLEDVRVVRAGNQSMVRVTVDLPDDEVGSLDSDRLGDVSRGISAALDDAEVVHGQYTLEVSTPGVSRPLTEPRHFRRARTRTVRLTLADGGTTTGRLREVVDDADGPVLVLDDGSRVALAGVRKGKVEVELKRLEDEDAGAARDDEEG